jgi:hypothetical protein
MTDNFLVEYALRGAIGSGSELLWKLLGVPQLWLASILAIVFFCRLGWRRQMMSRIRHTHVAAGVMLTLAIPLILSFPSWLALGGGPVPRTQNSIVYIFLMAWFGTFALISFKYLSRANLALAVQPVSSAVRAFVTLNCLALCVSLIQSDNVRLATTDLFEKAPAYDHAMQLRYEEMRAASKTGQYTATIPLISDPPLSIGALELSGSSDTPSFLDCFTYYFGVPRVIIE